MGLFEVYADGILINSFESLASAKLEVMNTFYSKKVRGYIFTSYKAWEFETIFNEFNN